MLATAGTVLATGCLDSAGDPGATGGRDEERSPTDYTHTGGPRSPEGCTAGFDVTARPLDPTEGLTLRLDDPERSLVADAVETGGAEASRYADTPPVDGGAYVEHERRYYETAARRVDSTEVPAVVTNVEWEKGQQAPDGADVIAFADLSSADREALRFAVYGGPLSREHEGHPKEGLSVREAPVPYPDGTHDSALVGDGERWVRWDDRTYRVWTGEETTKTRYRFRIEVTEVAEDADAFRSFVAEEHLLELAGLSKGERKVLRDATGGTYEACEADSGVASLQERLSEDDQLPPPRNTGWYVQFEGTRYVLKIYRWVH